MSSGNNVLINLSFCFFCFFLKERPYIFITILCLHFNHCRVSLPSVQLVCNIHYTGSYIIFLQLLRKFKSCYIVAIVLSDVETHLKNPPLPLPPLPHPLITAVYKGLQTYELLVSNVSIDDRLLLPQNMQLYSFLWLLGIFSRIHCWLVCGLHFFSTAYLRLHKPW